MYTIQENVRIVIAMLKQYGIHHIVISPGGTNIPISQAVQMNGVLCILLLVFISKQER